MSTATFLDASSTTTQSTSSTVTVGPFTFPQDIYTIITDQVKYAYDPRRDHGKVNQSRYAEALWNKTLVTLNGVATRLAKVQRDIDELIQQREQLTIDAQNENGNLEGVTKRYQELVSNLGGLEQEIGEKQKEVNTLQSQITGLQTAAQEREEKKQGLQETVNAADDKWRRASLLSTIGYGLIKHAPTVVSSRVGSILPSALELSNAQERGRTASEGLPVVEHELELLQGQIKTRQSGLDLLGKAIEQTRKSLNESRQNMESRKNDIQKIEQTQRSINEKLANLTIDRTKLTELQALAPRIRSSLSTILQMSNK